MTTYQERQVREIHAEKAATLKKYIARFGEGFVDVINLSYDGHGQGLVGFSCDFSGFRTGRRGSTLVEFARRHFGAGRLVKISTCDTGEKYAVIRTNA